ncbi:MAG: hypothetical protein WCG06_02480 [Candidatus Omnitrophota bacterium]
MRKFYILTILLLVFCHVAHAEQKITDDMLYSDQYILILKSTKDYNEALNFAKQASKKLGLKFDNEYRKYSQKDGIYFSATPKEGVSEGDYFPRRYSGEFITLENSKYYSELAPGYIIVVAGVYESKVSSHPALNKSKQYYIDAYVKKVNLWMGCVH